MSKHGKNHRAVLEKMPKGVCELKKAVEFLKEQGRVKFDETFELAMTLGVDASKGEQTVRGTVNLPHGTGKNVRIIVFAAGSAADAARKAGADEVGNEDLIEKVKAGWTGFDVAIATPEAMKEVRKLGRVLGPRGLMPNPKTGTVTDDTAAAVTQSKAGKVEFRLDKTGNINVPFGKRSFDAAKLVENAEAILSAIKAERPAAAKGAFIRKCYVSSTMGVGIPVQVSE